MLSVVVPTRDRPEMLARCLASLRPALRPGDQLLVVDSASRDAAAVAALAARYEAELVRCPLPGVNRARNAGWRAARHELVAFTDDDVELDPHWAEALVRCLSAHPEASFVTGWIGVPPGQDPGYQVAIKDDTEPARLDRSTRGILGHGASLAVRRSVLVELGGFDEAMGAGGRFRAAPEVDLFDRLFAAGHTGRFEPAARGWHDQWRRGGQVARLQLNYGIGSGARMAKLLRTDRSRLRVVAAECLWGWGLLELGQHLRRRNPRASAVAVVRLLGYAVGFARACVVPVRDGHYAG